MKVRNVSSSCYIFNNKIPLINFNNYKKTLRVLAINFKLAFSFFFLYLVAHTKVINLINSKTTQPRNWMKTYKIRFE